MLAQLRANDVDLHVKLIYELRRTLILAAKLVIEADAEIRVSARFNT